MQHTAAPARPLLVAALVASACGGKLSDHPAASVTKFLPATLETVRPREGDPRTAKVRIYVDPGIRALPHWKEDITDQIDYANQLLQPMLGVRLVVEAVNDWARRG